MLSAFCGLQKHFSPGLRQKIRSGQQPFSCVSIPSWDLSPAIDYLYKQFRIIGSVNIASPECVTQTAFNTAMGKVLHRPGFLNTPAFTVKFIFRQMGEELLLNWQHAVPHVLAKHGFTFKYPDIELALIDDLT